MKLNLIFLSAFLVLVIGYFAYSSQTTQPTPSPEKEKKPSNTSTETFAKEETTKNTPADPLSSVNTPIKEEIAPEPPLTKTKNPSTGTEPSPSPEIVYFSKIDTTPQPGDTPEIKKIKEALEKKIDAAIQQMPIEEAIALLASDLKINITLDPDLYAKAQMRYTTTVKNSPAKEYLNLLRSSLGAVYYYHKDEIYLVPAPENEIEFLDTYKTAEEVINALFPTFLKEHSKKKSILATSINSSIGSYCTTQKQNLTYTYLSTKFKEELSQISKSIPVESMEEREQKMFEVNEKYLPLFVNILNKDQQKQFVEYFRKIFLKSILENDY